MISVSLMRTPSGFLRKITAAGHAGYSKKGPDVVCAAISAIIQTAVGGLQDIAGIQPACVLENGLIECGVDDPESLDSKTHDAVRIIMETAAVGCRQIELSHGTRYVKVREADFTK